MSSAGGILYVVATPIGNLSDITLRALQVLRNADLIAAEDTRHCRRLLSHYSIDAPLVALHEHNERAKSLHLLRQLQEGRNIALVSDAGTPLINDPGFLLVKAATENGIAVCPLPGPCAAVTALSAAGIATDRFAFEGFPPRTHAARLKFFEKLAGETRTLIFYESSHRLEACLQDLSAAFPPERKLVIAKELTKLNEAILSLRVSDATSLLKQHPDLRKGEFVLLLEGAPTKLPDELTSEQRRVLSLLLSELPLKTAVTLAETITGARKKILYQAALDHQQQNSSNS